MRTATLLLLLAACAAPPSTSTGTGPAPSRDPEAGLLEPRPPAEPTPWTEAFLSPAVLMADSILVEGPPGLLEHVATRADDALFERRVETRPEGLLQTIRVRPDSAGIEVVRAQLDAWQLAAIREVAFLERVDPATPVRVVARGDAVWRDTNGNERRELELIFLGPLPGDE
jgi:hypothetical protein